MNPKQTTCHLMMIRPVNFQFNEETAINNAFQQVNNDKEVHQKAQDEFDAFVEVLRDAGIDVTVIDDTPTPVTPDSIFPNNWISFHSGDTIVLYPMYAVNRRAERKQHVLDALHNKFQINATLDFSDNEENDRFLEGTGSMVLDRQNNIAYACLSQRTDLKLLGEWCEKMNFSACAFHSVDEHSNDIYHTNVMMCVADQYVVICLDSIRNEAEKKEVITKLKSTGKEIIEIGYEQMNHFAGNMLQVENKEGNKFLVMSSQAYHSLNERQIQKIESFNPILHSPLYTIEKNGGGSARCMMAEVFLNPKR